MARRLGDVLDVYVEPSRRPQSARTLLIPLDPSARIAAAVALRVVASLNARGFRLSVEGVDPAARALCGLTVGRAGGLRAQIATAAVARCPDGVLAIVASGVSGALPGDWWWSRLGTPGWVGFVGIGPSDASGGGPRIAASGGTWLASIPEREAIRVSLGARSGSVEAAATAVAAWLVGPPALL